MALAPHLHARPLLQPFHFDPGQRAVTGEAGRIEIHAVVRAVGVPLFFQDADHLDLLGDVIGSPGHHIGQLDAQAPQVFQIVPDVLLGDVPGSAPRRSRCLLQLILACVGVRRQVTHVGDVDDMPYLIPQPAQRLLEHVRKYIAPQIADVGVGIDRRTAGVDLRTSPIHGLEDLLAAGERVVQFQFHLLPMGPGASDWGKTSRS